MASDGSRTVYVIAYFGRIIYTLYSMGVGLGLISCPQVPSQPRHPSAVHESAPKITKLSYSQQISKVYLSYLLRIVQVAMMWGANPHGRLTPAGGIFSAAVPAAHGHANQFVTRQYSIPLSFG